MISLLQYFLIKVETLSGLKTFTSISGDKLEALKGSSGESILSECQGLAVKQARVLIYVTLLDTL